VFIWSISTFIIASCYLKHAALAWQRLERPLISYSHS
jgi:hypothetical protein